MKAHATRDTARNFRGLLAPLWFFGIAAGGLAVADASLDVDSGQIAEIVVTAQRREESLSKVPISVTAVTPAQMQTDDVGSTIELPRVTPGLTVGSTAQSNAWFTPVLRGVGALTPAVANDNSVALYVDGIYQSDKTASVLDLAAVSQIEVLKGPQGTLFGRNATGGAINVITRGPTDKPELEAEVSYGNLNKQTERLFAAMPLNDQLGISLAYMHRGGGNYEHNTNPLYLGDFGGTSSDAFQTKLVWTPGDFQAIASIIYLYRKTTDLNALSPVPGTDPIGVQVGGTAGFDRYTYTGSPVKATVSYLESSLKMKYSLPGLDVVSISGYTGARDFQGLDYDGTSADLFYFNNFIHIRDISEELQLLTTGSGPLQVTGGLYFYHGHPQSPELDILENVPYNIDAGAAALATTSTVPGGVVERIKEGGINNARAVYAQATYALDNSNKLTGGLRYSEENRTYDYTVSAIGGDGTGLPPVLTTLYTVDRPKAQFDKLTWRFAFDHQFSDDILGYASYNRGFKSGVYNFSDFTPPCAPGATTGCPPPAVKPEQLDAFEVGIKSFLFDKTLQVNAAVFYYNYKDIQVSRISTLGTSVQEIQNAAAERIYGLDGDLTWRVTSDATVRANFSYLHARFTNYDNAGGFLIAANGVPYAASIDATNTQGLGAPTFSGDIGGDYAIHLGATKFVITGDYFHTDSFKTVVGDGNVVNAYGLVNAAVTWYAEGDRYYVRLYGHNLSDVEQIGTATSPFRLAKAEIEPRTYGIALGVKF